MELSTGHMIELSLAAVLSLMLKSFWLLHSIRAVFGCGCVIVPRVTLQQMPVRFIPMIHGGDPGISVDMACRAKATM